MPIPMPRAAVFGASNIGVDANTNTNAAAPPAPKSAPKPAAEADASKAPHSPPASASDPIAAARAISANIRRAVKFGLAALYVYAGVLVALMFFVAIVVPLVPAYEARCAQFSRALAPASTSLQAATDFEACSAVRVMVVMGIPVALVVLVGGAHFWHIRPMQRLAAVIEALVSLVEAK